MARITAILLFAGLMQVSASVYSQKTRLNLKLKDAPVESVLKVIEEQSEFYFLYRSDLLKKVPKVSLDMKEVRLEEVLDHVVVPYGFGYEVDDQVVVIKKTEEKKPLEKQKLIAQQENQVTGTIKDASGQPLPGVTVVVRGTTTGTVTDVDGNFTLSGVPDNATIVFSFVGMKAQEIVVGNQTILNVTMQTDAIGLDEVIAIGYGTARKRDLTGSIVNVQAEELIKYQPTNVQELLRSAVPGLKVGYSTSAKNTPEFEVRGDNTIKSDDDDERAGNRPLIVLDGIIFNGDIAEINVNDIASVDVLKDASAASIYGSRASNGVIVFTTKKGKLGKPQIRVSAKYGLVTKGERNETYTGEPMLKWLTDVQESLSGTIEESWSIYDDPRKLSGGDLEAWKEASGIAGETNQDVINERWLQTLGLDSDEIMHFQNGRDFDWQDFLFHTGQRQDYDLSVSGRNENVSYYWSLGFVDSESLKMDEKYTAITSRLNLDVKVTDFLNAGVYANFTYPDEGPGSWEDNGIENGGYRTASPYDTPWEARVWYDDEIQQTGDDVYLYDNIYLKQNLSGSNRGNMFLPPAYTTRKYDRYRLFPTMFAKLSLPFGISFETKITTRLDFRRRFYYEDSSNPEWGHGGEVRRRHNQTYEWQFDNILTWNKQFDEHRIAATGLVNAERNQSWYTDARNSDLQPTEALGYHGIGYGVFPVVGSDDQGTTRTALMGRVNYSYSNRYNLSASIRQDGYSRFGANYVHATFPSVSAAWTLTNEAFMAGRPNWLEFLKVRASWGVNGNSSGLSSYAAYSNLDRNKILNWSGGFFPANRLTIERIANPNLAWEKNNAFNLGIDYGLWSGRLTGALDIYSSKTTDLLLNKKLPVLTGFNEITTNVGSLKNSGFDLSVNSVNIENSNFRWTTSLNVSYNQNEIISLTGELVEMTDADGNTYMAEPDDFDNGWFIGENKDVIWNFEMGDVYSTDEADEAEKWGLQPGDFRVVDQNGDGVLNTDDKVFQGLSKNPWYLTMRNDFTWKNFDMGVVFLSKLGYKGESSYPFNVDQTLIKNHNWYSKFKYWTPQNQTKDFARINSIRLNSDMQIYVPRDYLRLQNLSLGYNIPSNVLETIKVSRARVAFNAENVFVLTEWYDGDPESRLEMPRTWSFSVDFSF
ncbi:SusC/RagA family TonB-linked outer membrane protein [Mariniphaga sediminis]|uniref:SusC/RagA family TonB-linked outer membrane protein n=1 Tax=Mariniphaga sediminis TaxID=1628158 RepID=UPI003563C105